MMIKTMCILFLFFLLLTDVNTLRKSESNTFLKSTSSTGYTTLQPNDKILIMSWKGDYLHRPDTTQGVTTWTGAEASIGNVWTVEYDGSYVKFKSWKNDYLHRPDTANDVTSWGDSTSVGDKWIVVASGDKVVLQSWKQDYLHRPDTDYGVVAYTGGNSIMGNLWTITRVTSYILYSGSSMYMTNRLENSASYFELQGDGNMVIYCKFNTGNQPIYATNTSQQGYRLTLDTTGNLVLYDAYGNIKWQTNTANKGTAPYQLYMQIDSNLVLYDSKNTLIWSSGTANYCSNKSVCLTSSSLDASATSNSLTVKYQNLAYKGTFECTINAMGLGETKCCDAQRTGDFNPGSYCDVALTKSKWLTIYGGSDGVRLESITVDGITIDKFYPNGLFDTSYMDGYLAGSCWKRFWLDSKGNGSCKNASIQLCAYFSSTDGDCGKITCN